MQQKYHTLKKKKEKIIALRKNKFLRKNELEKKKKEDIGTIFCFCKNKIQNHFPLHNIWSCSTKNYIFEMGMTPSVSVS